jgi:hypothetical protein
MSLERRVAEIERAQSRPAAPKVARDVGTDLRRDDRGRLIGDEENVLRILGQDERLCGIVRFNEFTGELMLWLPIPAASTGDVVSERGLPRPWADTDTTSLKAHLQAEFIRNSGGTRSRRRSHFTHDGTPVITQRIRALRSRAAPASGSTGVASHPGQAARHRHWRRSGR